jgi:(p)ppGpp synthase/HD superfamily hydrolase
MALCCNPKPGQRIVGAIGKGVVTIHRFDCENMDRVSLARRIPARWSSMKVDGIRIAVDLTFHDRRGLLRQLTDIFYKANLDIESVSTETLE